MKHTSDKNSSLTAEYLRSILSYDQETGQFTRLVGRPGNGSRKGAIAGNFRKQDGYFQIWIDGRLYLSHRLAWLYMTGTWPKGEVDHRDKDKSNNRWDNLRDATHGQNQANSALYRNNKSGYRGVRKIGGTWEATIRFQKKTYRLGRFKTPQEASFAYAAAASRFHGDFAGELT